MIETMLLEQLPFIRAFAVQVALSGVCVCAVVLLVARLLSRRSEPLRYGILLVGVICLLAVPALVGLGQLVPADWLRPATPPGEQVVTVSADMLPRLLQARATEPFEEPANAESVWRPLLEPSIAAVILAVWLFGVVFGVVRLGCALLKQRRIILGERWRPGFWTEDLKSQLAAKLGLRQFPEVYVSPAAPMPMVVGLWRPRIVLPQQASGAWSQPQWEAVLLHEGAHVARCDPWAALVQRLAIVLFWWCPLARLLGSRLNDLREKICDDCALAGRCDRVTYSEMLLEAAERLLSLKTLTVPLGLLNSARGGLEARITRLLAQEKRPMTHVSRSGRLLAGVVLAGACLLTTAGTAISWGQPPAQAQKKVQIKIIVDGKEVDLNDTNIVRVIEAAAQEKSAPMLPARIVTFEDTKDPKTSVLFLAQALAQDKPGETRKADPRIDELVRQAEAIKPGSGEAVRRALQGDAKPTDRLIINEMRLPMAHAVPETVLRGAGQAGKVVAQPSQHVYRVVESTAGKKFLILSMEDGKVRQLSDEEVKKLLEEKGGHHTVRETTTYPRTIQAQPTPVPARFETKPAPATSATDLDALRRQLERLSHELNDLRSRLEAGKKSP